MVPQLWFMFVPASTALRQVVFSQPAGEVVVEFLNDLDDVQGNPIDSQNVPQD